MFRFNQNSGKQPMIKIKTRSYSSILLLLSLGLLLSCSEQPDSQVSDQQADYVIPASSPNDRREYRALTLENRLRVLLISDPQAETSAASVDVNAGYNSDPQNFQGLAHFLEHMLFLGTEKYPASGEYQEYISSHGGSHNAYTAYENTNYYFDIEASYLEPTLDRFAQFFIAPLFNEEYVEREKNAVNSEYQSNLQNDGRRSNSIWKQIINPDHPIAKFSTGNLQTLTDQPGTSLRQALLEHYAAHYSANQMTVAILGRESLDELESMAREKFSTVPDRNLSAPQTDAPLFLPEQLPALLEYQPIRNNRSLSYTFPIPVVIEHYREKPTAFLGHLLGHEGEGSLLSLLKRLGWANGLSAGGGLSYEDNATFSVNISLTETGQEHLDEISNYLFQAIALVREQGLQFWLFEEQQQMAELGFAFQEPASAVSTVSSLSRRMQEYPLEEIMTAPFAYENFNPDFLNTLLAALRPDNVLLTYTSQQVQPTQSDPWYNASYHYQTLSDDRIALWQSSSVDPALSIPEPNPFLPDDISLKSPEFRDINSLSLQDMVSKPELILEEDGIRLWFEQDDIFAQPRANFFLYAMTPLFSESLEASVLSSLAISLLNDRLNEYEYPANLAGVFYQLSRRSRGFTLSLRGYNDRQPILLEEVLQTLQAADFDERRFLIIRAEMIRALENARFQNPYVRAYGEVQNLLSNPYWSDEERLDMLASIDFQQVLDFVPDMLRGLRIDALYHGNGNREDALALIAEIREYLQSSAELEIPPFGSVLKMPAGQRVVLELEVPHDDSALVLYLQAPDDSLNSRALLSVLGTMIRSPFFDDLRTENQLGYIVNAGAMSLMDVSGLVMYAQSPVADPLTLENYINDFIASYAGTLNRMSEEEFTAIKSGLLNSLLEKPQRMGSLSARYWNDILEQDLQQDSLLELAAAVEAVSLDEVRTYYQSHVIAAEPGRLLARSFGSVHQQAYAEAQQNYAPETTVLVESAESYRAFKAAQEVYLFNGTAD
jgi:insulysin